MSRCCKELSISEDYGSDICSEHICPLHQWQFAGAAPGHTDKLWREVSLSLILGNAIRCQRMPEAKEVSQIKAWNGCASRK